MKLSTFDLNHLRALHYLLDEAHVARAAKKLNITAAAGSNALKRLRTELADPLLVKVGRTLRRTALGEQLRGPARELMASAQRLLDVAAPFDAAIHRGELILSTADMVAEVLGPSLDRLLAERSPNSTLWLRTGPEPIGVLRDLGGLAIGPQSREPGVRSEPLFRDDYVCVMRKGHPLEKGRFTLERFSRAEHVIVAPRAQSARGVVDDLLQRHGLARRVTRAVTGFAVAIALVAGSDRIVILPRTFALARCQNDALAVREMPLALPKLELTTMWHEVHDADARLQWFRGLLREALRGLSPR